MKRIKLSEEAYRLLEEYRRKLSEELGREISYTEALARLLNTCGTRTSALAVQS